MTSIVYKGSGSLWPGSDVQFHFFVFLRFSSVCPSIHMISESELARFVADEHRLIVELLARGIFRPSWTCAHGRDHYPSVTSRQFRCRCIREDSRKTIFYCSFFENTSLPIATVFRLAYDWIADLPVRGCPIAVQCRRTLYAFTIATSDNSQLRRSLLRLFASAE